MGDALRLTSSMKHAKSSIESMYRDKISVFKKVDKPTNVGFDNRSELVELYSNIPAKVSMSGLKSTANEAQPMQQYDAVIYTSNNITIPAGAIIKIRDSNGNAITYRRASHGYKSYATHQEIQVVYDEVD